MGVFPEKVVEKLRILGTDYAPELLKGMDAELVQMMEAFAAASLSAAPK
jgi:hypothetical protein